jgi:alkanesulfonate monooxygenase SsuD/methylene tetrahydromethanopterin reductase-like flavin-dependent oxidoreductase (luciferase family)
VIQRLRPLQQPHPPIGIGGDSPAAYRRAREADGGASIHALIAATRDTLIGNI